MLVAPLHWEVEAVVRPGETYGIDSMENFVGSASAWDVLDHDCADRCEILLLVLRNCRVLRARQALQILWAACRLPFEVDIGVAVLRAHGAFAGRVADQLSIVAVIASRLFACHARRSTVGTAPGPVRILAADVHLCSCPLAPMLATRHETETYDRGLEQEKARPGSCSEL